ncbi:MAG: YfhO family protein [Acidobacteriota bacterium]|nr:YfhO family protein [Blastocatellia bacterium]MDW8413529.1 YfhO family protein [Acidobacteriota bacterium]
MTRQHLVALCGLLLVVIALFWRVVFLGETLVDLAAHSRQLPWGSNIAGYEGYPFNHRDLTDTYVTRDYFVVDSYRNSELPLWNPYNFCGHPIYADGVTRPFALTNLFYVFFDVPLGYSLSRLAEYYLTAAFLYIFLIVLGLSPLAAIVAALTLLLSDHLLYHLTWLGWTGGLMWLPMILVGAELAIERRCHRWAIFSGIALALQFYNGFIPTMIYYLAATVLYYLGAATLSYLNEKKLRVFKAPLVYTSVTLAVGFGLSAPVWMPILELLAHSNRKVVPTELGYIWIPPWHLLTLIFPRAFGEAFDTFYLKLFVEMGVSQERSLYLGIAALPLLTIGLLKHEDRRKYYFAALALLALLTVTLVPLYVHMTKYIPVLKTIRATTRVSCLYGFATAALVAYGVEVILKLTRPEVDHFLATVRKCCFGWFAVSTVLTTLPLFKIPEPTGSLPQRWLLKVLSGLSMQFELRINNYGLFLPAAVVLCILLLTFQANISPRRLLAFIVLILATELWWNGTQYNRSYPRTQLYAPTKVTNFLLERLSTTAVPSRVLVVPAELGGKLAERGRRIVAPPNTLLPYRIATISGKDQLFPKWYRTLTALVEPQEELSHVVFSHPVSPLYDLLGVKYFLTRAENSLNNYREIFLEEGVKVYQNDKAMPRVFFAEDIIKTSSQAEAISLLYSVDLRHTVVVEAQGDFCAATGSEMAEITKYSNNRVVVKTASTARGTQLLVLTDTWYPGWEVRIDGQKAELLRANVALRAVAVPAGSHTIEFVFRPQTLRRGAITAIIVSLASLIGFIKFRRDVPWVNG